MLLVGSKVSRYYRDNPGLVLSLPLGFLSLAAVHQISLLPSCTLYVLAFSSSFLLLFPPLPPPLRFFPFLNPFSPLIPSFSLPCPSSPLLLLSPLPSSPPLLSPSSSREWHTNVNSKPALTMKETSQQKKLVSSHCVIHRDLAADQPCT